MFAGARHISTDGGESRGRRIIKLGRIQSRTRPARVALASQEKNLSTIQQDSVMENPCGSHRPGNCSERTGRRVVDFCRSQGPGSGEIAAGNQNRPIIQDCCGMSFTT